jgi:hypothetical protein
MTRHSLVSRALVAVAVAVAMAVLASAPSFAGEVYGKITMKGASVGDAATVAAECGAKSFPAKATDKSGTYHLIVGQTGKCVLVIGYKGATARLDMVSHEDAVQYDVDLDMKDGQLAARRR